MFIVPLCYLLMVGIAFAIPVGICIVEKFHEQKVARMPKADFSHQFLA